MNEYGVFRNEVGVMMGFVRVACDALYRERFSPFFGKQVYVHDILESFCLLLRTKDALGIIPRHSPSSSSSLPHACFHSPRQNLS